MVFREMVLPVSVMGIGMEVCRLWYHRKVVRTIKVIKD